MDSESAGAVNNQNVGDAATTTVDTHPSEPAPRGAAQSGMPDATEAAPTVLAEPIPQAPASQPAPFAAPEPVSAPFEASLYGMPPYGAEAAVSKPRNMLALLGLIFAIPVWPAGLVLSALGLFKAVSRRTGKAVAVVGLVLSIATGGVLIAGLAAASSTVAASTALDPGCASIEAHLASDITTLQTDTAGMQSDKDSASSSNGSIGTVNTDLSAIQAELTAASGVATHSDVKSDLNDMQTQVGEVGKALIAVQAHSRSSDGAAAAALTTLQSTDADLGALCAAY